MAKIDGGFSFQGSVGGFTAYRMHGVDGIILRKKSGSVSKKVREGPNFDATKRVNQEFGGRSSVVKWVMANLRPHMACADFNPSGKLNALLRSVQAMDTESKYGQRSIDLSRYPSLLEGFSLNEKVPLHSIIRSPIRVQALRGVPNPTIEIPALLPGVNFRPSGKYSFYGFVASLGIVPDMYFSEHGYQSSPYEINRISPVVVETPWSPVSVASEAQTINLEYPMVFPDNKHTQLLVLSVRYGAIGETGEVRQVVHAGAATILASV